MCVYDIRRFAMTTSCTLNSIEKKRSKSLAIRFFFSTNKKPCIYQLLGHTIVIESNLASSLCITDTQWTLLATCRILGVIYVNSSTTEVLRCQLDSSRYDSIYDELRISSTFEVVRYCSAKLYQRDVYQQRIRENTWISVSHNMIGHYCDEESSCRNQI